MYRNVFRKDFEALTDENELLTCPWSLGFQKYQVKARVCGPKLTFNFQAKFHMSFIILLVNSTCSVSIFLAIEGFYEFS